jgi:predicted phosphoribosyltransferase/pimeloyl-ACP methyl ester carboxylesterase
MFITGYKLEADLCLPNPAKAIILVAHGSGSDRQSTRNQYVAQMFNDAGFGTLLVDLLNADEKKVDNMTKHLRFDIDLLASRIESITQWLLNYSESRDLSIGYFGSSTGAAASLIASLIFKNEVRAIVLRGGRPDLAEDKLGNVSAPTLLIVGAFDTDIIETNKSALNELNQAQARALITIPGAGHLFEEIGKMEEVAKAAVDWFECHLLASGKHFENKYMENAHGLISQFKTKLVPRIKFKDRDAAGEMLAGLLVKYRKDTPIVLGIPRGGVVVADVIARKLSANLDIVISKKMRAPNNSEFALGALVQDGSFYLDKAIVDSLDVSYEYIEAEKLEQKREMDRRLSIYRPLRKEHEFKDKTTILVDDGAATGSTIIAAARWIRKQKPKKVIIALPVAPRQIFEALRREADEINILRIPKKFGSVSDFYLDYDPVSDQRVIELLDNWIDTAEK